MTRGPEVRKDGINAGMLEIRFTIAEFAEDVAEDMARVVGPPSAMIEVLYGTFDNAIRIMEWNPLETHKPEFKYYVAGVGLVLEVHPSGETVELVSIE